MTLPRTETAGSIGIAVAGEDLRLLPERAVYWPRERTLFIADPHFGKAQTFRSAGIAAPERSHSADLETLSLLIEHADAASLVVLGDLLHSRSGVRDSVIDALGSWRTRHRSLAVTLVRGNHDRSAGDPPKQLNMKCVSPGERRGPFELVHEPDKASGNGYALSGHLHPGVQLGGSGGLGRKTAAKLPAFVFGANCAVLPAFGRFTGLAGVRPAEGDRLAVIADGEVIALNFGRDA